MVKNLALVLLWCAVSITTFADDDLPLLDVHLGTFESPPLYYTSTKGNFSGALGETVKALCRESRLNCTITMFPVARAYHNIEVGETQVLLTGKYDRFKECCISSLWEYPWKAGLFSRLPMDEIPKNERELVGSSLIMVRGWQSIYRTFPNLERLAGGNTVSVYTASNDDNAIEMLHRQRAQFLWGGDNYLWKMENMGLGGEFNYRPLLTVPVVLWISKKEPEIIKRFNYGYKQLLDAQQLGDKQLLLPAILTPILEAPMIQ